MERRVGDTDELDQGSLFLFEFDDEVRRDLGNLHLRQGLADLVDLRVCPPPVVWMMSSQKAASVEVSASRKLAESNSG